MLDSCFQLSRTFLKIKNRSYKRFLHQHKPFRTNLSILTGQRGVGKTTVMIQHMLEFEADITSHKILYIPSDHFSIEGLKLYDIAENFYQRGGQLLCIDEIHTYEMWSKELKSIADTFPDLKVIASGSSLLKLKEGTHDLSRRSVFYNLPGLSFREFVEMETGTTLTPYTLENLVTSHESIGQEIISALKAQRILELFGTYLRHGYYPYYKDFPDNEDSFFLTLEQGAHISIRSDLVSLFPKISGGSIKKMEQLLSVIARSAPFKPDMRKLTQSLDIGDERTLKDYIYKLEDAGIIYTLSKSSSPLGALVKPEKMYLNNTNQIFAFGSKQENLGNLRETFFLSSTSPTHSVSYPKQGDFKIGKYLFEVGGKKKNFQQIKDIENSFLALDELETGYGNKIPLWLMGFLY